MNWLKRFFKTSEWPKAPEPPTPPPMPEAEEPKILFNHDPEEVAIWPDGFVRKMVWKDTIISSRQCKSTGGFVIDEEHPVTIARRKLDHNKKLGMLRQKDEVFVMPTQPAGGITWESFRNALDWLDKIEKRKGEE